MFKLSYPLGRVAVGSKDPIIVGHGQQPQISKKVRFDFLHLQ